MNSSAYLDVEKIVKTIHDNPLLLLLLLVAFSAVFVAEIITDEKRKKDKAVKLRNGSNEKVSKGQPSIYETEKA